MNAASEFSAAAKLAATEEPSHVDLNDPNGGMFAMETGYARLRPLGLAVAFAAAAVVEIILLFVPMVAMHRGMIVPERGMMSPRFGMMGAGPGMGFGMMLLVWVWIVVVSASVGAIVAAVYNAFVTPKRS
jgi:hypothetical protein